MSFQVKRIDLSEETQEWRNAVAMSAFCPVDYLPTYIELCGLTMLPKFSSVEVYNFLFMENKRPAGVWSVQVRTGEEKTEIGSNEGELLSPLFLGQAGENTKKHILDFCVSWLAEQMETKKILSWQSRCPVREEGISPWQRKLLEGADGNGAIYAVRHILYHRLPEKWEETHKNTYRKSYRSLISKGMKSWDVQVRDAISWEEMNAFREFHIKVKGGATRSVRTWEKQMDAINQKEGFLVLLKDPGARIRGGAVFLASGDESYYNSAAYDLSLRSEPLGHLVQHAAIAHAQRTGCRWHKLGDRAYGRDLPAPSEKEMQISRFKEGFSTHIFQDILIRWERNEK